MAVEVLIMSKESTDPHPDWRGDWQALTMALVRRAASGDPTVIEIYLLLLGDDRCGDNRKRLDEYYSAVQDHTWCSTLYLVVDAQVDSHPEQLTALPSRRLWLKSAIKGGVDDILLAPLQRLSPSLPTLLRRKCDEAEEKRIHLPKLVSTRTWHCLTNSNLWAHFLETPIGQPPEIMKRDNILIVVEKKPSQLRYISELLEKGFEGKVVIGYVGPPEKPVPNQLTRFCLENTLVELKFGGLLELQLYLMRLNQLGQHLARSTSDERMQAVEINVPAQFSPVTLARETGLLIVSSFDSDVPQDCLAAARDVGMLRRDLPPQTRLVVHPAISCRQLPDLLQLLPSQIVLTFIGHGNGANGMQEFHSGKYITPERWLECFAAYNGSLSLAFFSSCRSTETARLFAQAGAGVAIGFGADVLPRACQKLAEQVVQAALRTKGDRSEILRAFQYGCRILKAEGLDEAQPLAFYSER